MDTTDTGLPAGVEDAVLNRSQLARALNKSEPTISAWIGEGLPYITEGTNGRAYEFQLSACWRWMKLREKTDNDRQEAAEAAVRQMRLALIGGTDPDDGRGALSPKEQRDLYDAERAYMLTALQRGEQVKRAEMIAVLEDVFLIVRDSVTALPDRLEREAGITGKALDLAIGVCDSILVEAQKAVEQQMTGEAFKEAAE